MNNDFYNTPSSSVKNESIFKVLLVEDSLLLRNLIVDILNDIQGIGIIGFAEDEISALKHIEQLKPDLAIIDLELKSGTGIGILQTLFQKRNDFNAIRRIVFSNHTHDTIKQRCQQLGADAFFDKSLQLDEMVEYIHHQMSDFKNQM